MIAPSDIDLLRAFLARERADFADRTVTGVDALLTKVMDALQREDSADSKANYLVIHSLGNTGVITRSLWLTASADAFDPSAPNLEVILCTCGRIEHWGSLSYSDSR